MAKYRKKNDELTAKMYGLTKGAQNIAADLTDFAAKYRKLTAKMYGFKEELWHEAICDESENVVSVEAFPGDKKREKQVFLISCHLVEDIYGFFAKHGTPQNKETN